MSQRWVKVSRNLSSILDALGHAAGSSEKTWAIHDSTRQTEQFEVATMKSSVDEVPEFKIGKAKGSETQKIEVKKPTEIVKRPVEANKKPVEKPLESPRTGVSEPRSKFVDLMLCDAPDEEVLHKSTST